MQADKPFHRHVSLINGMATAARIYPPKLVKTILVGLREQLRTDGDMHSLDVMPSPHEPEVP
eukprot:2671640-Amphidinium_carterae.1